MSSLVHEAVLLQNPPRGHVRLKATGQDYVRVPLEEGMVTGRTHSNSHHALAPPGLGEPVAKLDHAATDDFLESDHPDEPTV